MVLNNLPRIKRTNLIEYSLIFVAVPILTFYVGRFLDKILLLPSFPPFPTNLILGMGVFFFGLTIGIKSTRLLYKIGKGLPWGEVKKEDQSTKLVTTGLYSYCRNPMTFGYSLLPCGMGIMFRSLSMTLLIPITIFSIMIIWLKLWEEPKLEKRFGATYQKYKAETPFLIPRFKPLLTDLTNQIVIFLQEKPKTLPLKSKKADKTKEIN